MTLVSPDNIELNAEITSAGVNTPVNQLASVINGQIDSTNISSVSGAKINAGTIPASALDENANPETRLSESLGDFVASGLIWSAVSGLNGTMTAGVAYIAGKRLDVDAVGSHSFTASRDTYVYLDNTGSIQYDPRTNGAAQPATPAGAIGLAKVVTNGSTVTSVVKSPNKIDANGWAVYGVGSAKAYFKEVPVNFTSAPEDLASAFATSSLPVGIATVSEVYNQATMHVEGGTSNGYARLFYVDTSAPTASSVTMGYKSTSTSSINIIGRVTWHLKVK